MSVTLSFPAIKELTKEYLEGTPVSALAKKYKISSASVKKYVELSPKTRTDIEEKYFRNRIEWENIQIAKLKEDYFNSIQEAINEFRNIKGPDKVKLLDSLRQSMADVDKQFRLNNEMATEHFKETKKTLHLDVAKTLKELKTPQDKKNFLLEQVNV